MATLTAHFGFLKPVVNDPIDQDQWGYQLNTNLDSVDTLHYAWSTTSIGTVRPDYAAAGTQWINNTTNPWVWNVFSGTTDIVLGNIDTVTNTFTPGGTAALTTKGDLLTYSTQPVRLGVGTNGQVLTADSTATDGVKWSSSNSIGAWFNAVGTGTTSPLTIRANYNIASVVRTGAGLYTVTFSTALPSANYACSAIGQRQLGNPPNDVMMALQFNNNNSATQCFVAAIDATNNAVDLATFCMIFVGG